MMGFHHTFTEFGELLVFQTKRVGSLEDLGLKSSTIYRCDDSEITGRSPRESGLRSSPTSHYSKLTLKLDDYGSKAGIEENSNEVVLRGNLSGLNQQ